MRDFRRSDGSCEPVLVSLKHAHWLWRRLLTCSNRKRITQGRLLIVPAFVTALQVACAGTSGKPSATGDWYPLSKEQAAVQLRDPKALGFHESSHSQRFGIERSRWGMRLGPHASFELRVQEPVADSSQRDTIANEVAAAWSKTTTVVVGDTHTAQNAMGEFEYCRFRAQPDRDCVYLRQLNVAPQAIGTTLRGWYCAAPSTPLEDAAARSFFDAYSVDPAKLR